MIKNVLLVGLGGAVGAMLRYGMTLLACALDWSGNMGTFLVNIIGSFIMGLLISCFGQGPWLLMATVGICGGFTTFSTFSMQSVTMLQQEKYGSALLYIVGTVVICIFAAFIGYLLGQKIVVR